MVSIRQYYNISWCQNHVWFLFRTYCYVMCLLVCLFPTRQPPSGPGPPHSRGF